MPGTRLRAFRSRPWLGDRRRLRRALRADGSRGDRLRSAWSKAHYPRRESDYAGLVQDEIYKKLFAFPRMVEDLMRGFAAREWAAAIDFSTLRKLPAEFVSDELLRRHGDTVWVVRFRDGRHLLMVLEFQSRDDPAMALRILAYTSLLYQELLRNEAPMLDAGRRLPLVLPVVVYNGGTPWKATNQPASLIQPAGRTLTPYQPSQLHYVPDERHAAEDDFPRQNLVTAMLHVERIDSPSDLVVALDVLRGRFRRPEDDDLRRAFTDWGG